MFKKSLALGLLLAMYAASSADVPTKGTTKPAVQARLEMEARSAETYTHAMNAANTASHYAEEQVASGKKEYLKVARACADCADMASVAAKLTARGSAMARHACEALAKCCDGCVAECEKRNDPELNACIDACKKAAEDCREMEKAR